ncbi:MAG: type II secretion system F family protein [Alphaproteobacteria bacterium]|nr:type II secretion system F family protein [Alphaproteobacteria bacterium]
MKLENFLPFGLSPDGVVLLLAAVAAFISVYVLWNVLLVRDPVGPRMKALKSRQVELKADLLAPKRRHERKVRGFGMMLNTVKSLNLSRFQKSKSVGQRLATAGWRSKDAVVVFIFFKVAMPVLFGAATAFVLFALGVYKMPDIAKLVLVVVFAGIGYYLPDVMVKNQATKRQHAIRKAMPDGLDLMVICAEAGLSIDSTLARVSREVAAAAPVLADELGLAAIELGFLPERSKAFHNLSARTNMMETRGMVNTLLQTEKFGTPLAQSLRVLSAEFRDQRMLRAEEKAARLPAILTVPMIVFILPCLFIVLIGPAILRTIDAMRGLGY